MPVPAVPIAALLATLLAAAPLLPSRTPLPLPFDPPRAAPRTHGLRCDTGTVIATVAESGTLRVRTPAGAVTYHVPPGTPAFDREGRAVTFTSLKPGERVRVYYVLDDGPQVAEIDLE